MKRFALLGWLGGGGYVLYLFYDFLTCEGCWPGRNQRWRHPR